MCNCTRNVKMGCIKLQCEMDMGKILLMVPYSLGRH